MSGLTFAMDEPPSPEEIQAALRQFNTPIRQRASLKASRTYAPPAMADALTRERRARPPAAPRRRPVATTDALPQEQRPGWLARQLGQHWLPLVGGMLLLLVLWYACATYVLPFAWDTVHHWQYGDARLSQIDLDVGHGGTSHFVALDLHGQIIVIEFPAKDPKQAHSYVAGYTTDDGQPRVVTLLVADVNQDGRPDLLVQVEGLSIPYVLYNTGRGFTITNPPTIQTGGK